MEVLSSRSCHGGLIGLRSIASSSRPSTLLLRTTLRSTNLSQQINGRALHTDYRIPYSRLRNPLLFSIAFTGTAFGLAYYLDSHAQSSPDPDAKIKVMSGLVAVNAVVFGTLFVTQGMRTGRFVQLINRFTQVDLTRVDRDYITVLTGGFSHRAVWHFGLNMLGLFSFGSAMVGVLGQNQFLALYTSSICWTSMAQLTAELMNARRGGIPLPMLGASGGIYALLGLSASFAPWSGVTIIFLPFFTLPLLYAFGGIMTVDLIGILRRWKGFGHAAHFSGGLLGLVYASSTIPEEWRRRCRNNLQAVMAKKWGWR